MKKSNARRIALASIIGLAFLLRVVKLSEYPVGLYSDEAVFGYNAYLLLHTGRDEFGRLWPMSLESFGDWKPPMQAWLAIPVIKIFGLNEFAVRLPSAILGTATILVIYLLAKELLFKKSTHNALRTTYVPLSAALLLAINPWHIFMSRIAMLVAVEIFFMSLGVLGLLKGLTRPRWWVVSAAAFAGAIYSYYGSRVTVPLIVAAFTLVYFRKISRAWRALFFPLLIGGLLILPLVYSSFLDSRVLTGRARTTSIFFNDNVRLMLWEARTQAGVKNIPPLVTRFFDNKLYYYARDIAVRYLSHFSPGFLFFRGDSHPPFKLAGLGYLHTVELPMFLLGLWLIRNERRSFLLLYLLAAPFVASLTFLTPAANRAFNLVIPWTIIAAYGLTSLLTVRPYSHAAVKSLVVLFYLVSLSLFTYSYLQLTPRQLPHHWHYGRRELVEKLAPLLPRYPIVYMSNQGGPPYIFLAFYLALPPGEFHPTVVRNPVINELGWGHVDKILNVIIPREFVWNEVPKKPDALYVGFGEEIPQEEVDILNRIYYPNGKVAYTIATLKQ